MALRELNASGVVSGDLTVNKTNVGTAVAAYTTAHLCYLAASAADHNVKSDAGAAGFTGIGYTLATAMRWSVADSARTTSVDHQQNDAAYISNAYTITLSHTTGDAIFEGWSRNIHGGGGAWGIQHNGGNSYFSHMIGATSSIYTHFNGNGTLGSGKCVVDHYRLQMKDGSSGNCTFVWNFSCGDKKMQFYNCAVIISNDTTTHSQVFRGQSSSQRVVIGNCYSTEAPGATAPTSAHANANCVAPDTMTEGYNASDDDTLPGTDTIALTDATDVSETVDQDNVDFTTTRAKLEAHDGGDVSALIYSDSSNYAYDLTDRGSPAEWFIGTEFIAGTSGAALDVYRAAERKLKVGFKGQGRWIQTTAFAAGSASQVLTPPAGTIGFYAKAANAFTVQANAAGGAFPFDAGQVSFYYEHETGDDVTIADQAASDTGAGAIAWVVEPSIG